MKNMDLLHEPGGRTRLLPAMLAGGLVLLVVLGLGLAGWISPVAAQAQGEPESGRVTVAVGEVVVTAPGQADAQPLAAGDVVAVGSTVRTGAGARVVIVMTPRSAIRVAENSAVVIESVDADAEQPKVTVDLRDGSLGALLKPGEGAAIDFQIRTPSGIAAARGTYFAVVVEDGVGYAQVKEGRVEVIPQQPDAAANGAAGDDVAPIEPVAPAAN